MYYVNVGLMTNHHATVMIRSVAANPRCSKPNVIRKDHLTCTNCGVYGHIIEKCYKLHYFPTGFKFTRGKSAIESHADNQVSELN
jgi:hypothetical protein